MHTFTSYHNSSLHLFYFILFLTENPLVSLGSLGEGWHNWHHKYPFDYAASEFGIEKQFNPTKLFIDTCVMLGLASDRKRATGAWSKLRVHREELIYGAGAVAAAAEGKKEL
jgi:stearoyl-CoA desaturase (Delta-9 desaturase)